MELSGLFVHLLFSDFNRPNLLCPFSPVVRNFRISEQNQNHANSGVAGFRKPTEFASDFPPCTRSLPFTSRHSLLGPSRPSADSPSTQPDALLARDVIDRRRASILTCDQTERLCVCVLLQFAALQVARTHAHTQISKTT
jgi:hypothetical protein